MTRLRRTVSTLLTCAVGLALVAGPAAAATRYVAPTGSGGGSCATPNHRTLAGAIAKAKAGDTILVCPGTYVGALTVTKNGLTIAATKPGKAVVTAGTGPVGDLIRVTGADRVTIRGLRLIAPTASCTNAVDTMVEIDDDANAVTIANLTLDVKGTLSLGDCGYAVGVSVGAQSDATVSGNRIIDFKDTGILVAGIGTRATIASNTVRYEHGAYLSVEPFTDEGIVVLGGASATVQDNAVKSLATAWHPAYVDPATPGLRTGIRIDGAGAGTIVRRNTVDRSLSRGMLLVDSDGLKVRSNVLDPIFDVGMEVSGVTGSTIADNTSFTSINEGILVQATSTGNTFSGNATRGGSYGCYDASTGAGTKGTANTWTDNTGFGDPVGICG